MNITIDDIIRQTRKTITERPNNKYNKTSKDGNITCLYSGGECDDGSCGCVFGQVLVNLGVEQERIKRWDLGTGLPIRRVLNDLFDIPDCLDARNKYDWCAIIQQKQDMGYKWGEALCKADAEFPNLKCIQ